MFAVLVVSKFVVVVQHVMVPISFGSRVLPTGTPLRLLRFRVYHRFPYYFHRHHVVCAVYVGEVEVV